MYKKSIGEGDLLLVRIYVVDDIIIMESSAKMVEEFRCTMKNSFEMSDLGIMTYFLGLEVRQMKQGIHICQQKYIRDILKGFNMELCKSMATLMNVSIKFQVKDDSGLADATKYRRLVGKFIYLTQLRPDITYIVGVLSRYMSKPTNLHFSACKRVLRYLAGTINFGIYYKKGGRN